MREKNPLINLPYIEVSNRVVTQSNAVYLWIGRKTGLNGSNDEEKEKNAQILFQVFDLRNATVGCAYKQPRDEAYIFIFTNSNAPIRKDCDLRPVMS